MKAIVFDLDDTLFLERDYALSGFRAVAEWVERGFGISAQETYADFERSFNAGVHTRIFDSWLTERGMTLDSVPEMVQVFRDHEPRIRALPSVEGLLRELRSSYSLGLVSDGFAEVQRRKLAALDLDGYFDAIVVSDELGREAWKPSPTPFLVLLRKLGVESRAAAYVADNPIKDFIGARKAGMWSIRVRSPQGVYRGLEAESPQHESDVEIEHLDELKGAINRVEKLILAAFPS